MKPYYTDNRCAIYHGDSREILKDSQWKGLVDLIVTDPPYGIAWRRGDNSGAGRSAAHAGIVGDADTSSRDYVLDFLLPDTPAVVFGSFYAPQPPRVRQVLVWKKPLDAGVVGSTTGYRRDAEPIYLCDPWPQKTVRWSSVLAPISQEQFRGAAAQAAGGHPHAKPLPLMRLLIDRSPGDVILDPFMGSGTTLRAAKDLGRNAIGIELEERYCEIAAKRMAQEVLDFGAAS